MEILLLALAGICFLVGLYYVLRFMVQVILGTVEQIDRLHEKMEKHF